MTGFLRPAYPFVIALCLVQSACMQNNAELNSASSHSSKASTEQLYELGELMLHDFATLPDNREQTIVDRRFAVEVDGQDGIWFYSQMNTGDDQKLYRQRIHQLALANEGQGVVQRSYTLKTPANLEDAWDNPAVTGRLSLDELETALNAGCEQNWSKGNDGVWRGVVDPKNCAIFSERRQANIRIGSDSLYRGNEYGTSERGFDDDMQPIWGSPIGQYITLKRCKSVKCTAEAQALRERTS